MRYRVMSYFVDAAAQDLQDHILDVEISLGDEHSLIRSVIDLCNPLNIQHFLSTLHNCVWNIFYEAVN